MTRFRVAVEDTTGRRLVGAARFQARASVEDGFLMVQGAQFGGFVGTLYVVVEELKVQKLRGGELREIDSKVVYMQKLLVSQGNIHFEGTPVKANAKL